MKRYNFLTGNFHPNIFRLSHINLIQNMRMIVKIYIEKVFMQIYSK
ncbi:hypothetical protein BSF41_22500 [Flavobacterium sp. ACN2]|nr:hypothetical protein BSF41_22500 [Flavobacterium sp. ACN2]